VLLHDWPDNLRGLDRLVHDLASLGKRGEIGLADLPGRLPRRAVRAAGKLNVRPPSPPSDAADPGPPAIQPGYAKAPVPSREEFERVFQAEGGNVRAMARHFQRDRRQIYRWLDTYGMRGKDDDGK
jgi:transcriptional regulator of acetoin/glycerol metabolism